MSRTVRDKLLYVFKPRKYRRLYVIIVTEHVIHILGKWVVDKYDKNRIAGITILHTNTLSFTVRDNDFMLSFLPAFYKSGGHRCFFRM